MQNKPLMLYVNPAWNRSGLHTPLLFPFWGNPTEEASLFTKELFDSFSFDTSLYQVTDDIKEADMVLPPYKQQWFLRHDMHLWEECIKTAQTAKLPLLIDGTGDVEPPVNVENAYVLRIGGYRFMPEKNNIQVPPAIDDLLERCCEGQLIIRKKTPDKPIVSFAGWATLTPMQTLRAVIKELPVRLRGIFDIRCRTMIKGVFWRAKAIRILGRSDKVKLNLKARASFSGSTKTAQGDLRTLRKEFVENILASDYCLDVRGDPNTSSRMYEICSLGRIPVVLDTERNFPFSEVLNYHDFCLIVDFRDLKRMPDIIDDFHKKISPEKFETMQRKARETFVNYFRIDALIRHIIREINLRNTKSSHKA